MIVTRGQEGFTLLEVIVSLAIFSMVVLGSFSVIGAVEISSFEGFTTGPSAVRNGRDYTAASVYLQAFQEFVASRGGYNALPGTYCVGSGCSPVVDLPAGLAGYPVPPGEAYQLTWTTLSVVIERWHWDDTTDTDGTGPDKGKTHCLIGSAGCGALASAEYVTRVAPTLTWVTRGVTRSVSVERIVPP